MLGIIPAGTEVTDTDTGKQISFAYDIIADTHVIMEDIEISLFNYDGREYSVNTHDVIPTK